MVKHNYLWILIASLCLVMMLSCPYEAIGKSENGDLKYQIEFASKTSRYKENHLMWGNNYTIYLCDIHRREIIHQFQCGKGTNAIDFYGDNIVWSYTHDYDNASYKIMLHDIRTNTTTELHEGNGIQPSISIWAEYVCWYQYKGGSNSTIMFQNLQTNETREILDSKNIKAHRVFIYKKSIVYSDSSREDNIFLYNINADDEIQISNASGIQEHPSMSNDIIVWKDIRHNQSDIYYHNFNQSEEYQITNTPFNEGTPKIYGNHIVYSRNVDEEYSRLYMYDIIAKEEYCITIDQESPLHQFNIWGDYIVYSTEKVDGVVVYNLSWDTDQDGLPDYKDPDDDNDGYPDVDEIANGTDMLDPNDPDGENNNIDSSTIISVTIIATVAASFLCYKRRGSRRR